MSNNYEHLLGAYSDTGTEINPSPQLRNEKCSALDPNQRGNPVRPKMRPSPRQGRSTDVRFSLEGEVRGLVCLVPHCAASV